jgi:hypothetical protein
MWGPTPTSFWDRGAGALRAPLRARFGRACRGWMQRGVAPSRQGGPGFKQRENFDIWKQNYAF